MSKENISINILRKVVIDGFLLCGLVITLIAIDNYWEPFMRGFFCDDESLKYPYKDDTVTVPMLRVVGLGLPIITIIICEWALLRSERDDQRCLRVPIPAWVRGVYCSLTSFGIGVCFVELTANIAKRIIGRLRPHFFDICQPSVDCNSSEWIGRYIQSSQYTCTGSHIDKFGDMRKSFLSGHSSWAAYTMVYLALYLEKRMVWSGTRVLRNTLQFIALMLSWYTALSRVSDYKHHWSDVLAGYSMGLIGAVLVWNWGTDLVQRKKQHSPVPLFDLTVVGSQQMIAAAS